MAATTHALPVSQDLTFASRLKCYAQLMKLRLSSLVLFSAATGFFMAPTAMNWSAFIALLLGGILVTGAANAANQIIERYSDRLMHRTQNRPLPTGQLKVAESIIFTAAMAITGIVLLWGVLNPLSGLLGMLAFVSYAFVYTPLKKISPIAVFVGAIPGAIPPMLGWVAATGTFGVEPGILFAIQFLWQFPHFWAIAWKLDADYSKAGFKLLPSATGKSKYSALHIVVYTLFLIPLSLTPTFFGLSGYVYAFVALACGISFLYYAIKLYRTLDEKAATQLMFASFFYLPIVQLVMVLNS